ncbi:hypothetical protein ACFVYT_27520 [Streptomyces sp. NPDC058290]|uniref:hypothetical protein n=1 Tax=Streptomyces sp. NPDC058290 TaxID=3346426 RepID=UPI0036E7FD0E
MWLNVGQVAAGSMLLLEYTPVGAPARQYTLGPFVFPPGAGRGPYRCDLHPKRPHEVSLPERLPKSTRGLVVGMAVSGAVLVACAVRIVLAVQG